MRAEQTSKRTRAGTPNTQTATGFGIADALWAVLAPRLPVHVNTHRLGGGRLRVPDRRCADTIFYVLRTGCQWPAVDQTARVAHSTAHDQYPAWVRAAGFRRFWHTGGAQFEARPGSAGTVSSLAGARTNAPLGGEKPDPLPPTAAKTLSNLAC